MHYLAFALVDGGFHVPNQMIHALLLHALLIFVPRLYNLSLNPIPMMPPPVDLRRPLVVIPFSNVHLLEWVAKNLISPIN